MSTETAYIFPSSVLCVYVFGGGGGGGGAKGVGAKGGSLELHRHQLPVIATFVIQRKEKAFSILREQN